MPGIQIDGYFPDTSTTNTNHGWNHDAQFVIRLPDRVERRPRRHRRPRRARPVRQRPHHRRLGAGQGYAFAATDKGNTGAAFYRDGRAPGDADRRVEPAGSPSSPGPPGGRRASVPPAARPHLMAGISNGGYLVRWQLENHPELYDGGVDWEGTLWRAEGPNLLTFLPPALQHYPAYAAAGRPGGPRRDHRRRLRTRARSSCGRSTTSTTGTSPSGSTARSSTRRTTAPLEAGIPFCASGTPACDADYDYASRPAAVHDAVDRSR